MQETSDFLSVPPANSTMAPHIAYYYFHIRREENYPQDYIFYPHYGNALNVYKDANVIWNEQGRILEAIDEEKPTPLYTIPEDKPRTLTVRGEVRAIGIIFKPLGINHFINTSLDALISGVVTPFNYLGKRLLICC